MTRTEGGVGHLTPAGSGTIASLDGIIFVITAGHVVDAVKRASSAGIYGIASPSANLRAVEFNPQQAAYIIHWNGKEGPDGPDIGAIRLPPEATEQIAQSRVVYNINRRIQKPKDSADFPDLIFAGVPTTAKMKNVLVSETQRKDEITLSLLSGTRTPSVGDEGGFVRFDFSPVYETASPPPSTFQGMSGGGIWRLDADAPNTVPILTGVSFYESDASHDGERMITCSGPQAVYERVLGDVVRDWIASGSS
jgi:hypothetical protein